VGRAVRLLLIAPGCAEAKGWGQFAPYLRGVFAKGVTSIERIMGLLRRLFLCLCLCAPWVGAPAAVPAVSSDAFDGSQFEVFEDRDGQLTLAQVLQRPAADWAPAGPNPTYGYSRSTYWFRLTLRNDSPAPQERLLEIQSPLLDWLDIHVLDAAGRAVKHWALGDKRPFAARPLAHRHFVVPLQWQEKSALQLVVRLQSSGSLQLPAHLWTAAAFDRYRDTSLIAHGLYFGSMLAMLAYNLVLLVTVRGGSYFWYVLWVATLSAFAGSLTGLSFQFLWPDATQWNDTSIVVFLPLALGCGALFTRSFLRLANAAPRSAQLSRAMAAAAWILALASFVVPYGLMIRMVVIASLLFIAIGCAIGLMRLRDGFVPARYYLMAWGFVLAGGGVIALARWGVLPSNPWTDGAAQAGSVVEALLLSLALAARINAERRLREQAQAETLRTHRQANEQLERRVLERTAELERANRLLHELSQTDGLTGVHNRRHFDAALALESQRASRSAGPLALLLIDIDHFKQINDQHGHAAGDECLKQVARLICRHARRSTDLVARYGGEEFCALMPGVGAAEAAQIAEQIRLHIEQSVFDGDGVRLRLTASVGVCTRVPDADGDDQAMLKAADVALYEAKRRGRNRVVLAGEAWADAV
jgi:diguanylate cyclase